MMLHVAGSVRLARADFGILGGSMYNSSFDRARSATVSDSVDIVFEIESWRTVAANVRPAPVVAALERIASGGVGAQVQRVRERRTTTDSNQWEGVAFGQTFVTLALVLLEKTPESVAFARALVDLFPGSTNARLALGFASETAGDRKTALQAYARVIAEMYPNVVRAYSRHGEALALAGRRTEAEEAFAKALRLDPMESRAMSYRRASLR
jgi:tetratricopeptide (TPR) repeat protein